MATFSVITDWTYTCQSPLALRLRELLNSGQITVGERRVIELPFDLLDSKMLDIGVYTFVLSTDNINEILDSMRIIF